MEKGVSSVAGGKLSRQVVRLEPLSRPAGCDQIDLVIGLVLRLHIAGFATRPAIVLAIFAEANVELGTAQPAVFDATASSLDLVTEGANKIFRHERSLPRVTRCPQSPMVLRPEAAVTSDLCAVSPDLHGFDVEPQRKCPPATTIEMSP